MVFFFHLEVFLHQTSLRTNWAEQKENRKKIVRFIEHTLDQRTFVIIEFDPSLLRFMFGLAYSYKLEFVASHRKMNETNSEKKMMFFKVTLDALHIKLHLCIFFLSILCICSCTFSLLQWAKILCLTTNWCTQRMDICSDVFG